jgi:iron complex transport system permease protein
MTPLTASAVEWGVGQRRIVGPLDLSLEPGECLGIIGPNGAGKTSLLRLLAGLESPTAGDVELDARPLAGWTAKARARRIAYVPQVRPADVPLSVFELLLSARYPYLSMRQVAPAASDFTAVARAAERVGIEPLLERPLGELSGGERQTAYIAAALAQASEVLLLDEPTTHLDAGNRRRVASLLLELRQNAGHTMVVATHDLRFAGRLCDRLLALRGGRVVECAAPEEILRPAMLERLFDAPFRLWREAGEILPILELDQEEARTEGAVSRRRLRFGLLVVFWLAVTIAAPSLGEHPIAWGGIVDAGSTDYVIFWNIRLPRVLLALLAGGALAAAGLAFQTLFRNPLAEPYTLGVASGAALGAVVAIELGAGASLPGLSAIGGASFAGASLVSILILGLAARRKFSTATLLLAGIAMSLTCSALILFLQYRADFTQSFRMVRWMMGGLAVVGYREVLWLAPWVAGGLLMLLALRWDLNALLTGEEVAASRGVDLSRLRWLVLAAASAMVGALVAVVGPIGFVGLIVPHVLRRWWGHDHLLLLPACVLGGGAFLALADLVGRTVIAPTELPVGVVTALLGGPFFLWLLLTRR